MADHIPEAYEVELTSGRYLNVVSPDHRALELNDVAEPLAKTARYGGATAGKFFSVAEHAVLVALKLGRLGAPLSLQLAGLHHDDPEAWTSDIQRPVKVALRAINAAQGTTHDAYADITRKLEHAVWRAFAWADGTMLWTPGDEHQPLVKEVDNWACAFEASHIMPSRGKHWEQTWMLTSSTRPIPPHDEDEILCLEWRDARDLYVAMHTFLSDRALAVAEAAA